MVGNYKFYLHFSFQIKFEKKIVGELLWKYILCIIVKVYKYAHLCV